MSNKINNTGDYLDLSFGLNGDGKTPMLFGPGEYGSPNGIAVAADRSLWVACKTDYRTYGLVSLTKDGVPKKSFANEGFHTDYFAPGYGSQGIGVTVLKNGQIMVAGYADFTENGQPQQATGLALYSKDGLPVQTFGKNGKVILEPMGLPVQVIPHTEINQSVNASADQNINVIELADGSFMVLGKHRISALGEVCMLMKVTINGSLDLTFGDGKGYVVIQYMTRSTLTKSLIQLQDGTFVVGGVVSRADKSLIIIAHFDQMGRPIESFGTWYGYAVFDISPSDDLIQVMETPEGNILVVLNIMPNGLPTAALICLDREGKYVNDFNQGEHLVISTPSGNSAKAGVALDDGNIVVVGSTLGSNTKIFITKLDKKGKPVPTFGTDGLLFMKLSDSFDSPLSMTIQEDRVVMGAVCFSASSKNYGTYAIRCSEPI